MSFDTIGRVSLSILVFLFLVGLAAAFAIAPIDYPGPSAFWWFVAGGTHASLWHSTNDEIFKAERDG